MPNIIYALLVIVVIVIAFIGWNYARLANNAKQRRKSKQSYVKENIEHFGANNRGTSMDKQKIFVVSSSDLGIEET